MLTFYLSLALTLPAAEPSVQVPIFALHKADGTAATGPLQDLGDNWSLTLGGMTPARTDGANVLSLRRTDVPLPPPPIEPQVIFANGDRLAGTARELAKERLTFHPAHDVKQDFSLSLSTLAVLYLADPVGVEDTALLRRRLLAEKRKRDVVALRNGDVIEGTLTRLDKDGFHVEVDRKEVAVERSKVAYVAMSTDLMRVLRPKGTYAHLVLADGARLGLLSASSDGKKLTGKALFGATLTVPVEQVVALDLRQGPAVYLSDLKPAAYKHTPYLGVEWPYVADGSVAPGSTNGCDLRLAGSTYDKGLGMHSASRITYALDGSYKRFEALVGLDEKTCPKGSVYVKVLVDGKLRDFGWDKELTARDGPKPVGLNIAGAKELTLVVDFGRGGWWDTQGRVNWADARLVK